jgi:Kdo2-lipid IVA lauroyltransferase/acyltransferase
MDQGLQTKPPPLPENWRPLQRIKNTFIYFAIKSLATLFISCPKFLMSLFLYGVATVAHRLPLPENKRALDNLQRVFPQKSLSSLKEIRRKMYHHLGQSVAELLQLQKSQNTHATIHFIEKERVELQEALANEKAVIVITGHIGNWELFAHFMAQYVPVTTVAKALYDPRLTQWVGQIRRRSGIEVIWRSSTKASKQILKSLRKKGVLALLIDQHTNVDEVWVPFLGHPAPTPSGAARLAIRSEAAVFGMAMVRHGKEHKIVSQRLSYSVSDDKNVDVQNLSEQMNDFLSNVILQAPEQWVWFHKRWPNKIGLE